MFLSRESAAEFHYRDAAHSAQPDYQVAFYRLLISRPCTFMLVAGSEKCKKRPIAVRDTARTSSKSGPRLCIKCKLASFALGAPIEFMKAEIIVILLRIPHVQFYIL